MAENQLTVSSLYRELYDALLSEWQDRADPWDMAVLGECAFVLDLQAQAIEFFNAASKMSAETTILESPAEQIELFSSFGFRRDRALETASFLRRLVKRNKATKMVGISTSALAAMEIDARAAIVVHMSDIHFGKRSDENGVQISMHRFGTGDYSQPLIDHMKAELVSAGGRFSLLGKPIVVVVSGDFVYTAAEKEFLEALQFFQELRRILELPSERFVFCPGNHDVNWALSSMDIHKRFDNYLSFLRKFYGNDLLEKLYPLIKWDFSFDGMRPMPDDLISVFYYKEENAFFASFNSCVYETEQHHYGYISLRQQQKMAKLIEMSEIGSDAIRIGVFHHHIHPYPEFFEVKKDIGHWIDMSTIRDGGLFERFLERHAFDIVLHGHKHQAQLRETLLRDRVAEKDLKPLIVCGAGSCGVSSQELSHSTGNQYEVIEVIGRPRTAGADFIRVEWRELSLDPAAEWATTKVWNVRGG